MRPSPPVRPARLYMSVSLLYSYTNHSTGAECRLRSRRFWLHRTSAIGLRSFSLPRSYAY